MSAPLTRAGAEALELLGLADNNGWHCMSESDDDSGNIKDWYNVRKVAHFGVGEVIGRGPTMLSALRAAKEVADGLA